ncbi:MAG: hypothetical protein IPJ81_17655 [Chitinophagaceae bacterium]|nr:hypothetical protein [Chitinophagaceae bacterium]
MGILKNIFGNKPKLFLLPVQGDFEKKINLAITIMATGTDQENYYEKVIAEMIANDISEIDANELYTLLPTAFCRHIYPDLPWTDVYKEMHAGNKIIEGRFSKNPYFLAIYKTTTEFFNEYYKDDSTIKHTDSTVKIAALSAELKLISTCLEKGDPPIEQIALNPIYILRD